MAAMSQLQPLFTKGAIDQITKLLSGGKADIDLVALYAVLIFVTDVGQTLMSNIGGYLGDMVAVKLQRLMSQRYYEHLLTLPQAYFDSELTGKIINRMNRGINQITDFIQMVSNNFLQFIFSTIFTLIIVAIYAWPVALMLLSLYPIFIGFTIKTSGKWQSYQKKINEQLDIASGRFAESIGQIKVVKSFLREASELKYFNKRFETVVKTTRPQSRFWHKQDVLRRLVLNVIFLLVFVYIFVETAHGLYSLGTMVMLIQYAMLIRIPIFSISFVVDQAQRAVANTKDYFDAMDVRPDLTDDKNAKKLIIQSASIEFKNVVFHYPGSPLVLKQISFSLEPGMKAALVGESGQGKTTITSLILHLYAIKNGEILIDGQNINKVTQESLRESIAVVFQEPYLFSGTIRENISYGSAQATDRAIISAAKSANAHEFISKFKKGYDTEIGERGLRLSGGQKQRIAIARAILKDAPILILDEATSSLDTKSERKVQQALSRLMKGRTTLIIAHRLSTIASVDRIITIDGGIVQEIGTPEELENSGGIYAKLLNFQKIHTTAGEKRLKKYEIEAI